jgi:AcrR family transcriptional regulator
VIPAPSRAQLPRDERRAQILRAAACAFAREGFAATSVDEVAKSAGITKLIVYRHFDSKAALYRAILDDVTVRLAEEWGSASFEQHTRGAAARTLLRVGRSNPDGFRLLFVHAAREVEFAGYAAEIRALQTGLAEEMLAPLPLDDLLRRWATSVLVDQLVVAVLGWLDDGDPDRDDEWVDLVTAGLRAEIETWVARGT